jgi:hypothetical protein
MRLSPKRWARRLYRAFASPQNTNLATTLVMALGCSVVVVLTADLLTPLARAISSVHWLQQWLS